VPACLALGIVVLVVLASLNLLLKRRPVGPGLQPDGDDAPHSTAANRSANVVDATWVAVDWTLGRAWRPARFSWVAAGIFAWYRMLPYLMVASQGMLGPGDLARSPFDWRSWPSGITRAWRVFRARLP
jgi:hypothetical protein